MRTIDEIIKDTLDVMDRTNDLMVKVLINITDDKDTSPEHSVLWEELLSAAATIKSSTQKIRMLEKKRGKAPKQEHISRPR